jgi:hypothetical protein
MHSLRQNVFYGLILKVCFCMLIGKPTLTPHQLDDFCINDKRNVFVAQEKKTCNCNEMNSDKYRALEGIFFIKISLYLYKFRIYENDKSFLILNEL